MNRQKSDRQTQERRGDDKVQHGRSSMRVGGSAFGRDAIKSLLSQPVTEIVSLDTWLVARRARPERKVPTVGGPLFSGTLPLTSWYRYWRHRLGTVPVLRPGDARRLSLVATRSRRHSSALPKKHTRSSPSTPVGDTTAGMICVSRRRSPVITGPLQVKQQKDRPLRDDPCAVVRTPQFCGIKLHQCSTRRVPSTKTVHLPGAKWRACPVSLPVGGTTAGRARAA
jgi:hypothetical protein